MRVKRSLGVAVGLGLYMMGPPVAGAAALKSCTSTRWVAAWQAPPTHAAQGMQLTDLVEGSGGPQPTYSNATVRAIFTPTYGGGTLRVHLSNRFGKVPVTFGKATLARRASGATVVPATVRSLAFSGRPSVTVAPGMDVVSDPVDLRYRAFQTLAVSVYLPGDVGKATQHFGARQTSYFTPAGGGDATADVSGERFTQSTLTRPFVVGLDVRAKRSVGAVAALGDSLTDGAMNQINGVLDNPTGRDENVRYPDWLGRRIVAAGRPFTVINSGIGGNKLLQDGGVGGNFDAFGPSVIHRLQQDVLSQAGVTTVILWSGINDVSQSPRASAGDLTAGYVQVIKRLHAAGIRVLQGTLTPFTGYPPTLLSDEADEEARRQAVNAWIRTTSPADAVLDFDAAVRDPQNPSHLAARYDDGEHLHLNADGYKRIALAVPLRQLKRVACAARKR